MFLFGFYPHLIIPFPWNPVPPPHPWGDGSTVVQKHCYTARKFAQSNEYVRLLVHADGPDEVKQLTFAQPLSPLPSSLELVAILRSAFDKLRVRYELFIICFVR